MENDSIDIYERQRRLIGSEACERLHGARVALAGLGGVGGAAFEALARAGVGHILACDCDVFEQSNLNRQILATSGTIGLSKCAAALARAESIDPSIDAVALELRLSQENIEDFFAFSPDYVIDAVDSVSAKLALIEQSLKRGVRVISCMGTGNRIFADFEIVDIADTASSGCPLARVMRRELKRRGIVSGVKTLCGKTPPFPPADGERAPASVSFVPPVAGYLIAGEVIRDIIST